MRPIPAIGTVIRCSQKDVQFLGSNVPVIRVVKKGDEWLVSEDPKRGLHVYITEPVHIVLNKLTEVRLTFVSHQVAHAEAVNASVSK